MALTLNKEMMSLEPPLGVLSLSLFSESVCLRELNLRHTPAHTQSQASYEYTTSSDICRITLPSIINNQQDVLGLFIPMPRTTDNLPPRLLEWQLR